MDKKEFKELFLKLTEWTIPFGKESTLEKYLPPGFRKDSIGNYYYRIGNPTESRTLFTTHLDTYSKDYEKVNHVFDEKDPYIVKTDGKTILGGDNKLGCCILISMIKDNIPGTYYFFIGEEPILSGGLYGSTEALESEKLRPFNFFKQFDRCIAFDRKEYGSIVVRQMGRMCCSSEFAKRIANEFDIKGIKWDSTKGFGYYTDTAVFMDVIPECTNISAGGFNEHFTSEWVDLNYTYNVYLAAKDLDWESLPTERVIEERFSEEESESKVKKFLGFSNKKVADEITKILTLIDLSLTRDLSKDGVRHLTFSKWLEDYDLDIFIKSGTIMLNNKKMSLSQFKSFIVKEFIDEIQDEINYLKRQKDFKTVDKILNAFNLPKTFSSKSPH